MRKVCVKVVTWWTLKTSVPLSVERPGSARGARGAREAWGAQACTTELKRFSVRTPQLPRVLIHPMGFDSFFASMLYINQPT